MLRLILATLFRAGEIEVTYQGNRFHNYQDPASRTPFTSNPAFRISLFSPRQSVGLKTLTQAVQQLEDLTGEEVDVEEGAIATAFKKVAAEELEKLYPLKATAEAHRLPILSMLSEYQQTLAGNSIVRFRRLRSHSHRERQGLRRNQRQGAEAAGSAECRAIGVLRQARQATDSLAAASGPRIPPSELEGTVARLKEHACVRIISWTPGRIEAKTDACSGRIEPPTATCSSAGRRRTESRIGEIKNRSRVGAAGSEQSEHGVATLLVAAAEPDLATTSDKACSPGRHVTRQIEPDRDGVRPGRGRRPEVLRPGQIARTLDRQ